MTVHDSAMDDQREMTSEESARLRAGAIALDIAKMAAEASGAEARFRALADYLLAALDADAVALFERRDGQRHGQRHGHPHSSLHTLAAASCRGTDRDVAERSLKTTAYRAVAAGSDIITTGNMDTGSGLLTRCDHHNMAIALGRRRPHSYVVARWTYADSGAPAHASQILPLIGPSLAVALEASAMAQDLRATDATGSSQRAVFWLTSEAILSVADDFTVLDANPALHRLLGLREGEATGQPCADVIHCRDERKVVLCGTDRCPLARAFATEGDLPVYDISWETRNGHACDMSASVTVDRGGSRKQAVFVARDVTTLNAANHMRSNFISMVSHELRTPLNSINGFLEIVTEGQVGPLNERQVEFLNYARVSTQQLTTLVEDVLFISKADSGQFQLRMATVDVPKLVQQAMQAVGPQAEKGCVTLHDRVEPEITVIRGDELRLQQVLSNLLGNAIKFSPMGGTVRLTVRTVPGWAVFSVSDEGEGVPPEDHARIFERFYQSTNATRSQSGGTGLGLAIAKLIVEQHGGRIAMVSGGGGGATFEFSIPAT